MQVQNSYELRVIVVDFISRYGNNANIYQILGKEDTLSTTPAQLRLVLRQMDIEGYIDISYSNKIRDEHNFRPIAEIRLLL
jgi:hypothetical protein